MSQLEELLQKYIRSGFIFMDLDQHSAIFLKIVNCVNKVQKIAVELYEAAEHGNLKIDGKRIGLLPEVYFIGRVEKFEESDLAIKEITTSSSTIYGLNYSSLNDVILNLSIKEPEFELLSNEVSSKLHLQSKDFNFESLINAFTNQIIYKIGRQLAYQKLALASGSEELQKLRSANLMREFNEIVEYHHQKDTIREKTIRKENLIESIANQSSETNQDQIHREKTARALDRFQQDILQIIDDLMRELVGSNHLYGGDAFLYGIKVVEEVSLNTNGISIVLHPLTKDDFDYVYILEEYIEFKRQNQFGERLPSAKISIRYEDTKEDEVFLNLEKIIASLRLFRVGSIDYSEFHVFSTAILEQDHNEHFSQGIEKAGTVYRRKRSILDRSGDSYLLALEDATRLNLFMDQVFQEIPESFVDSESPQDYLSVAYGYYIESVIGDSSFESKLATAIMGIESLFLSERGELKSRLSNRMAKVLGLFKTNDVEFSPIEIKKRVEKAYDIRSIYVHGVQSQKERGKIQREYGSTGRFLGFIQEKFRISINIFLAVRGNHLSKEDFLLLIDNSLIDDTENKKLADYIKVIQQFFRN